MKISQLAINSVSTRHASLEEGLDAYAAAGFRNIEFVIPHIIDQGAAKVKQLLDDRGQIAIGGFDCGISGFGTPEQQAANRDTFRRNAEFMAELGAKCIVFGTDGPDGEHADPIGPLSIALAETAAAIAHTGITLCCEFNWSPVVRSFRTAAELVERSGAANVGILFDPAHYHCTPSKFEQMTAARVPLIKHVHVDDMRDKPGELSNCNSDRALPGQGCLDLKALFGQIEKYGYDGYFSIEMFSDELWEMPAAKAAKLMYDSMLPLCD